MNTIEKIAKKYAKDGYKKIEERIKERIIISHEYAIKRLYQEWNDLFEKAVANFYEYETKSYYRHGVGKGTGTGVNLYRANLSRLTNSPSFYKGTASTSILFRIDSDEMDDYWKPRREESGYGNILPAGYVLDVILSGIRGIAAAGGASGNYSPGRYAQSYEINVTDNFGNNYHANKLGDILDQFMDNQGTMYLKFLSIRFNDISHYSL